MRIKIVLCVLCVTAAHQWTITATSTRVYTHIIVLAGDCFVFGGVNNI